jgi:hypothetical protein
MWAQPGGGPFGGSRSAPSTQLPWPVCSLFQQDKTISTTMSFLHLGSVLRVVCRKMAGRSTNAARVRNQAIMFAPPWPQMARSVSPVCWLVRTCLGWKGVASFRRPLGMIPGWTHCLSQEQIRRLGFTHRQPKQVSLGCRSPQLAGHGLIVHALQSRPIGT